LRDGGLSHLPPLHSFRHPFRWHMRRSFPLQRVGTGDPPLRKPARAAFCCSVNRRRLRALRPATRLRLKPQPAQAPGKSQRYGTYHYPAPYPLPSCITNLACVRMHSLHRTISPLPCCRLFLSVSSPAACNAWYIIVLLSCTAPCHADAANACNLPAIRRMAGEQAAGSWRLFKAGRRRVGGGSIGQAWCIAAGAALWDLRWIGRFGW